MKCVSIVIPALNEEASIEKALSDIPKQELQKMGYEVQILVVDGDSIDHTAEIAMKSGAELIIESRPGYGRAYMTGFAKVKGNIIATADADGTYPLQDIPKLVKMLENENLDFITTNRFALMGKKAMPLRNRLGNLILAFEINLLFNLNMKDPESGMWVFRANILERLILKQKNNTFSHDIKLEACYFAKCSWKEVPINYISRYGGSAQLTKGWTGWKAGFADLFHIFSKRLVR